jgi:FMN phosphatase YigB (HAD superfamily)
LYTWRQYARDELFDAFYSYNGDESRDFDINLDGWFSRLVELLCEKYEVNLSRDSRRKLVDRMIDIEIQNEKSNIFVNYRLVGMLSRLKEMYPNLKIYYVSDMYLTSAQVNELLASQQVDIFDGGVTSTEQQASKHTGKLYSQLKDADVFGADFDIFHNLHIGDNPRADVAMANQAGSEALLWHVPRFRRMKTRIGRRRLKQIQHTARKADAEYLKNSLSSAPKNATRTIWQNIGKLFSQPLYVFLLHVINVAKNDPQTRFLAVSSESTLFDQKMRLMFPQTYRRMKNWQIAPGLNRKTTLRALIWALSQCHNSQFNAEAICQTILLGEIDLLHTRKEIYQFIFGESFPISELTLIQRSEKEFYHALLQDIRDASPEYVRALKDAYNYVKKLFPKDADERIVIVDVGWGGTVQTLFEQILNLHGLFNKVSGLYVGCHPADRFGVVAGEMRGYLMPNVRDTDDRSLWQAVIWEYAYTNKIQFPEDQDRLAQIQAGFADGTDLFRHIQTNPREYFDHVLRSELVRLINSPTAKEAQIIGSIYFDSGFASRHDFHIVDQSISTTRFRLRLLRHPKYMLREYVFKSNRWPAGYLRYYKLYGVKTLLKTLGFIRRKKYI